MENILVVENVEESNLKNFLIENFVNDGVLEEAKILQLFPPEKKSLWINLLPNFLSRYTVTLGSIYSTNKIK